MYVKNDYQLHNQTRTKDKIGKISLEALTNKETKGSQENKRDRRKGSLEERREDENYYQIKINLTF